MDMHGVFSHCMSNMGYTYLVHLGWTSPIVYQDNSLTCAMACIEYRQGHRT
jgi:hypothetical protein